MTSNLLVTEEPRKVGQDGKHLKFSVRDANANGLNRNVIGFRMGEYLGVLQESREKSNPIRMVYTLDENTWNGRTSIQLRAQDLQLQDGGWLG